MPTPPNGTTTTASGEVPDPPRVAWRKDMRARVLAAARELTRDSGWDQVSLAAVASRAQVSRPSVYKEFGNRAGLGQAMVIAETHQFLGGVAAALGPTDRDAADCLESAIHFVLTEAERNPLIRGVITAARQGSDSLLPYLTARADPVFDAAQDLLRGWLTERFPAPEADDIELAADTAVRMTISHLILPNWQPPRAAALLTRAVLRTLGEGRGATAS